jgi:hypothetical protein
MYVYYIYVCDAWELNCWKPGRQPFPFIYLIWRQSMTVGVYIHTTATTCIISASDGGRVADDSLHMPACPCARTPLASYRICILARASTWNETGLLHIYKHPGTQPRTTGIPATAWYKSFSKIKIQEKKSKTTATCTHDNNIYIYTAQGMIDRIRMYPPLLFGLHLGILYSIYFRVGSLYMHGFIDNMHNQH